jgi:Rap1a immunity proteins
MKVRHGIQVIVACISWWIGISVSKADYIDGNRLLDECTSLAFERKMFCLGYIDAISDAMQHQPVNGFEGCVSTAVGAGQVQDIVVDFLHEHPADRHLAAEGTVARAISEAFPCR